MSKANTTPSGTSQAGATGAYTPSSVVDTAVNQPKQNAAPSVDIEALKEQLKTELLKEIGQKKPPDQVSPDDDAYLKAPVEIQLFKDEKDYKDDYILSVNGKVFQIQRGKRVKIPRYVAMLIDSSQRQDLYAAKVIDEYRSQSKIDK